MQPDPVAIYEANMPSTPLDATGCGGGRIQDYWLNSDYVLRLAIGYYPRSEPGFKDTWAVIISTKDRRNYTRTPQASSNAPNQSATVQRP